MPILTNERGGMNVFTVYTCNGDGGVFVLLYVL